MLYAHLPSYSDWFRLPWHNPSYIMPDIEKDVGQLVLNYLPIHLSSCANFISGFGCCVQARRTNRQVRGKRNDFILRFYGNVPIYLKHLRTFVHSNHEDSAGQMGISSHTFFGMGKFYVLIKWNCSAKPLQLGSLRLLINDCSTSRRLFVFARTFKISMEVACLRLCGYLFPAFLFAFAQQIDSAIAAILNALTPLLTIIF